MFPWNTRTQRLVLLLWLLRPLSLPRTLQSSFIFEYRKACTPFGSFPRPWRYRSYPSALVIFLYPLPLFPRRFCLSLATLFRCVPIASVLPRFLSRYCNEPPCFPFFPSRWASHSYNLLANIDSKSSFVESCNPSPHICWPDLDL